MFRAVIVEDEQPILELMKVMISRDHNFIIAGAFIHPLEALERLPELKPDVVFIDVEMPRLNGIELANRIYALMPQTQIVFTTAYKDYALEAFEVQALDYILKPVTPASIKRVQERLNHKRVPNNVNSQKKRMAIRCFGEFEIRDAMGKPLHFRTRRAEELLAYFLCHPATYISKWRLLDLLWPEMAEKQSLSNFYNTLYLLRKMLKENNFGMEIKKLNDRYMLDIGEVDYDILAFDQAKSSESKAGLIAGQAEHLCSLYQGPLLENKPYLWKAALEEAYFKQYTMLIGELVERKSVAEQWDQVEELLGGYLSMYPLQENMHELLIGIYEQRGKKEKISRLQQQYLEAYRQEFGAEASEELKLK
ncbi:response regulator [Paenibacillus sp. GCM10012306]|uniref:response regulator n=1 Tax=Paenibacillus sp. GCM10012306 TaxID=3317342 RepID=UPI00360E4855